MNLSIHTALHPHSIKSRTSHKLIPSKRKLEVVKMEIFRACQPLRSAPITGASSLLRVNPSLIGYWSNRFPELAYCFSLFSPVSFPCSVTEPDSRSCHSSPTVPVLSFECPQDIHPSGAFVHTDCPPCLGHNRICRYDLSLRVAAPLILSNNMVLYDASTMVRSHLTHLLKPHLTASSGFMPILIEFQHQNHSRFHDAQYQPVKGKHLVVV